MNNVILNTEYYINTYGVNIFWAFVILAFGIIVSILMYRFSMFLFVRFNVIKLLERFELNINKEHEKTV